MTTHSRTQTVLVVDDDRQLLDMVRAILQENGFRVITAEDSTEALRIAVEHQEAVGLLLTDIVLPEMSGRKLAQCMAPLHPEMQILYMSGYGENVVNREQYGASLLNKPFGEAELLKKVQGIFLSSPNSSPAR